MRKLNKAGEVFTAGIVALVLIGAIATRATIETSKNGVLKKNGQKIWCKMLNKGNEFCDQQYQ